MIFYQYKYLKQTKSFLNSARIILVTLLYVNSAHAFSDTLNKRFSPQLQRKSISSWIDLRSKDVILQKLDYSCGAASLATLLSSYYGLDVTEQNVLDASDKDEWFSFADLQSVMQQYGFRAIGLAMNYNQLKKLKIPAIVYIETRSGPHFAVLRSISEDSVLLADPALGNSRLPVSRFLEKWNTRKNKRFQGKILVALPNEGTHTNINKAFFSPPDEENQLFEKQLYNTSVRLVSP